MKSILQPLELFLIESMFLAPESPLFTETHAPKYYTNYKIHIHGTLPKKLWCPLSFYFCEDHTSDQGQNGSFCEKTEGDLGFENNGNFFALFIATS